MLQFLLFFPIRFLLLSCFLSILPSKGSSVFFKRPCGRTPAVPVSQPWVFSFIVVCHPYFSACHLANHWSDSFDAVHFSIFRRRDFSAPASRPSVLRSKVVGQYQFPAFGTFKVAQTNSRSFSIFQDQTVELYSAHSNTTSAASPNVFQSDMISLPASLHSSFASLESETLGGPWHEVLINYQL